MTTEELFKDYSEYTALREQHYAYLVDEEDFKKALIEFANFHVNKALKQASEKVIIGKKGAFGTYWNQTDLIVDSDSILNAYNIENIK